MATAAAAGKETAPKSRPPVRTKRFELPSEVAAEFNVSMQTERHTEGLVATEDVPGLIAAFNLPEVNGITFPYRKHRGRAGDMWSLTIAPATVNTMEGTLQSLHRWAWVQEQPELTSSIN